ncbi:MAG: Ig-like domain-containing domain [Bacteroidota bacterium]
MLFYLISCASPRMPEGGPKDLRVPVLVASNPINGQRNFNGKKITLYFDEQVTENNIMSQLLITPYLKNLPRTQAVKNTEIIEFDDPLPPNTTISLNFREGIKDVHEGNTAQKLRLVFSTGPEIDSMEVSGHINELLTKKEGINVTVALWKTSDTLNVSKQKPIYFTKTDTSGNYYIGNIKEGKYEILAFEDRNNNLQYENKVELVGYKETLLSLAADSANRRADFEIANNDAEAPHRLDDAVKGWTYKITYNETIAKATFTLQENYKIYQRLSKNTVTLISHKPITDTLHAILNLTDSSGNTGQDTVKFRFADKRDTVKAKNSSRQPVFKLAQSANPFMPGKTINLEFSDSVKTYNLNGIALSRDSGKFEPLTDYKWNSTGDVLMIYPKPFSKNLRLYTEKGAFTIMNDSINKRTDTLTITPADEGNYGVINCSALNESGPFIIQLLNDRYEVIDQVANQKTHVFRYIVPGTYYLRLIEDANNNGQWDSGNYPRHTLPEKTKVYKDKIAIKANWEIEEIKL